MAPVRKQATVEADEWMSVEQTINAMGDSRPKVLNLVIQGVLVGRPVAGRTVITRASVDAEIERRKQSAASEEVAAAQ